MGTLTHRLKEEPRLGEGIYTSSDVADILKISPNRARYLISSYLDSKFKEQQNFKYRMEVDGSFSVNFLGLIELFVFDRFRRLKVSSQKIVKFHDYLAEIYKSPYPFAMTEFLVSGSDMYFKSGEDWVTGDKKMQIGFKEIVEFLGQRIAYDENKNIAYQYFPLGKTRSIIVDPKYSFGQPILKNTRLLVENLYDLYLAEGEDLDFVANLYKITPQEMKDVIEFMEAA